MLMLLRPMRFFPSADKHAQRFGAAHRRRLSLRAHNGQDDGEECDDELHDVRAMRLGKMSARMAEQRSTSIPAPLPKCHRENAPLTVADARAQARLAHTARQGYQHHMSPDAVKKFMHATPWKPFTLCLADGRKIDVPHPDFISISRAGRTVVLTNVDDEFEMVDVFLILSAKTKGRQKSAR